MVSNRKCHHRGSTLRVKSSGGEIQKYLNLATILQLSRPCVLNICILHFFHLKMGNHSPPGTLWSGTGKCFEMMKYLKILCVEAFLLVTYLQDSEVSLTIWWKDEESSLKSLVLNKYKNECRNVELELLGRVNKSE